MAGDEEAVREANTAFYRAFDQRDLEALAALWAEHAPVGCIHPGWAPLHGRESVVASWRSILEGQPPRIACFGARAYVFGDCAFVICSERLESGTLAATNVFAREDGVWKLVHHQAGPQPEPVDPGSSDTVH